MSEFTQAPEGGRVCQREGGQRKQPQIILICTKGENRHVVDIDPFDQQLQGQVECACMGTRPCPLQNACMLKAAEKLQNEDAMGGEADSQVEVDPQELPQGGPVCFSLIP